MKSKKTSPHRKNGKHLKRAKAMKKVRSLLVAGVPVTSATSSTVNQGDHNIELDSFGIGPH